jgi:cobalt-zinc-cadmium efflux system outer membrane protein
MRIVAFGVVCLMATAVSLAAQSRTVPEQLSLADALRLAEERNPQFAAARALIDAAEGDRITASRLPNPAFTAESSGYQFGSAQQSGFLNGQELTLRVDQEFQFAGQRRLRVQGAETAVATARAQAQDQLRRLQFDVKRTYYEAVLAKADREVARATLAEIDNVITLNRARLNVGEISGAELRRIQVERLRFSDDVFSADLAFRNAEAALLTLLGAPNLGEAFDPVDPLPAAKGNATALLASISPVSLQPAIAIAQAVSARPDVAAARSDVARAETETRLQRALRTPNLTFGAGYRRDFGQSGIVFGGTIPLPFFDRNQGPIVRADAERRAAESRARAAEAQVALDVQQALNALDVNRARVEYIERDYLKNAQESRDIVLASYRLGTTDLIDFLDAQRAFRDTLRTYNRALFEERISLFDLEAAVGAPAAINGSTRP